MENRLAQIPTPTGAVAEGPGRGQSLRTYEFIFEVTTQLLAAQGLEDQVSLLLDTATAATRRGPSSNSSGRVRTSSPSRSSAGSSRASAATRTSGSARPRTSSS